MSVSPERILDTRDPVNVGLAGPFVSPVSQKLQVTGSVPTTTGTKVVVPAGATGVLLNVTAVNTNADGFVSVRPGDAAGAPTTSSLNVEAGTIVPNAVQVALPTAGPNAGKIDITYDAYSVAGRTTDILVDVVGYTTNTGLQELVATVNDGPVTKTFGNLGSGGVLPSIVPPPASFAPTVNLTTTVPSRLFIQLTHSVAAPTGCTGVGRIMWLELDGVRIPSSFISPEFVAGQTDTFTLYGVTEGVVPAGVHSVRPRQACFTGTATTPSYRALVQGVFTYVSDAGPVNALSTGDATITATVAPCEGREVDGACVAE